MNRRDMLLGTGAFLTSALAGTAFAAGKEDHSGHAHMNHSANPYANLVASGSGCVQSGQACIRHCLEYFGDESLARCAKAVQEMLVMCSTLTYPASYRSDHIKAFAAICAKTCETCEAACREHADAHPPCKACADSCARCAAECRKAAA